MKSLMIAILFTFLATTAHAVKFSNQFIEFELPPKYKCGLEGTEWVCQSKDDKNKRDAIIILAAKLKGPQDTLDQYAAYLKAPKNYTTPTGQSITSKSKYVKYSTLNNHSWVDSLHDQSELPGFNTRYLATVKADIGVLVTYSVRKNKWQAYARQFEKLVNSLRVFRTGKALNEAKPQSANVFNDVSEQTQETMDNPFATGGGGKQQNLDMQKKGGGALILLLIIGAVAFIIWKKKKG